MKRFCYAILAFVLTLGGVQAQDENRKPDIPEKYKMFSKSMTRRMDLKIKQNKPLYSRNGEISKILFDALAAGDLNAYRSDSCRVIMPDSTLQNMMNIVETRMVPQDPNDPFSPMVQKKVVTPIPPTIFEVLYINEDVIFDRNRSRMYWYIQSLSLTVPGNPQYLNAYGIAGELDKVVHFKYEEVVEVLRSDKYKDRAIWYNDQNMSAHRNMVDAFELRLFSAPITKVENNEDLDIRQEYGNDPWTAVQVQQKYEHDLAEYEAELWSY
jgi:gliding motility associated protien GldN